MQTHMLAGMKFGVRSLMLAMLFVGIALAGAVPILREMELARDGEIFVALCRGFSPLVVPMLFAAYSAGRKSLTWQMIVALAVAEGLASFAAWTI